MTPANLNFLRQMSGFYKSLGFEWKDLCELFNWDKAAELAKKTETPWDDWAVRALKFLCTLPDGLRNQALKLLDIV